MAVSTLEGEAPGAAVNTAGDVEAGLPRDKAVTNSFRTSGMTIVFKDVSFSVPSNKGGRRGERAALLRGVSGYFPSGKMSALMGPSGSGKTTLLDVLAGRKTTGRTEGLVTFGGVRPTPAFLRRYTGYVEQFDTLIPVLTVHEMLMYTAELKRPLSEPLASKRQAVVELMQRLGLQECRDVKIGNPLNKGISGGQAKRTNIGIALITSPRVLFLDEPTSGLDSYTANEVMTVVKNLVDDGSGVTICATIHSPTSYCFSLFDRMMMLVRGRVVYFGERGAAAIEFALAALPAAKPFAAGMNDAEFLVDVVTDANRLAGGGEALGRHYEASGLAAANAADIDAMLAAGNAQLEEVLKKELSVRTETVTPWWWGIWTLLRYRSIRNYMDGEYLGARLGDKVVVALLIITIYLNAAKEWSPTNVANIAAVLFMWCALPAFGAAAYIPALVLERGLYIRERSDGLYRPATYLLAKMIEELFLAAISSAALAIAVFYAVGLHGSVLLFWLNFLATLACGIVLSYAIAALSPTIDVANATLPTIITVMLFFSGFFMRYAQIPKWWQWFYYASFISYAWGSLMDNEFGRCPPPACAFGGYDSVVHYFSLGRADGWAWFAYLWAFFALFSLAAWACLRFKVYSKR